MITKHITPDFINLALKHKDKLIIHATFTGYGRTVIEPCVPSTCEEHDAIIRLVKGGFPKERIVIRVDPIIPTLKGTRTALSAIETFMDLGFSRYRISVIDMYPHVRGRFKLAGLPLPYGDGFYPSQEQLARVDTMVKIAKAYWAEQHDSSLRIEACAEPGLHEVIACGCISTYDLALLVYVTSNPTVLGINEKIVCATLARQSFCNIDSNVHTAVCIATGGQRKKVQHDLGRWL